MTNRIAVPVCQLTVFLIFCQAMVVSDLRAEPFMLSGPGVVLTWDHADGRLRLTQVQCDDQQPLLYSDQETKQAGPGPVGNPLAVVIEQGKYAGRYGMETFRVIKLDRGERQLHAYLSHDTLPLQVAIQVRVEGHEAEWLGQVCWNGNEKIEADIYFPLLSRVKFDDPQRDRAITPHISGSVRGPLGKINYSSNYVGRFASPVFLIEGGGRGLAVLDDNRADLGPDPGATCLRTYVIGNAFPAIRRDKGPDQQGPLAGVAHTRVFRPVVDFGGEETYNSAERPPGRLVYTKTCDCSSPIRQ